jgi:hypothetical protein
MQQQEEAGPEGQIVALLQLLLQRRPPLRHAELLLLLRWGRCLAAAAVQ